MSVTFMIYERDCTLQRRHQKLIEISPGLTLPAAVRERIFAAAMSMAREVKYKSPGTFEFLTSPVRRRGNRTSSSWRPIRVFRSSIP